MSIRWFASLYSRNYQTWGKISPVHASRDSTPALHCPADMHALCTYVCVCVPVYMCMHGTMLACMAQCLHASMIIHDHPCMNLCIYVFMYLCLSVYLSVCLSVCLSDCLSICLSVSFNPLFCKLCVYACLFVMQCHVM